MREALSHIIVKLTMRLIFRDTEQDKKKRKYYEEVEKDEAEAKRSHITLRAMDSITECLVH